jgi:hypothetical protein
MPLRRRGWPVVYLGQNLPFADLETLIKQVQAQAVVLVATLEETARRPADWPNWIKEIAGGPQGTFAGRAFVIKPELVEQVPGFYLGDNFQAGMENLENILQ